MTSYVIFPTGLTWAQPTAKLPSNSGSGGAGVSSLNIPSSDRKHLYLSFGYNDVEGYIMKIELAMLLDTMIELY
jgi:hypothetical protein